MIIEKNTLYLVCTPIGNLDDMTFRAVEVLKNVDLIGAEDTRNSLKLLNHFDIKKPMISYYEHNKKERGDIIIAEILEGKTFALITDAGMPAISDPGEELVRQCHEAGIKVCPIPGASAVICAVSSSGLPTGRFAFEGFLSMNNKNRKAHLEGLVAEKRTMVFYEAPHKLKNTLLDFQKYFGDRGLCIAREITKKFEEIERTTVAKAIAKYDLTQPRGEFVLVLEGANDAEKIYDKEEIFALLKEFDDKGIRGRTGLRRCAS